MRPPSARWPLLLAALLLGAGPLRADPPRPFEGPTYVVLDRGRGAAARDAALRAEALELVGRLEATGRPVTVLLAGASPAGRPRLFTADPRPEALARALAREEGLRFEGPGDARHVLRTIQQRHAGTGGVEVFLLGPFGDALPEAEEAEARAALAAWNERGPRPARVWPIGLSPAGSARLAEARGRVGRGAVVLAQGPPEVGVAPWSPLDTPAPEVHLEARLPLRVLAAGAGRPGPIVGLDAAAGAAVERTSDAEGERFAIRWPLALGREARLSFRLEAGADVLVLCDPPAPFGLPIPDPEPGWILAAPEGGAPAPFSALRVRPGTQVERTYRLRRTRAGPPSAWRVEAREGPLPPGLEAAVAPEADAGADLLEARLTVRYAPAPGPAVPARGVLRVCNDPLGPPQELPFAVEPAPQRWRLAAGAGPRQVRLPPAAQDPLPLLEVEGEDEPLDGPFVLTATWDPPGAPAAVRVWLEDERGTRHPPDAAGRFDVGSARRLGVRIEAPAEPAATAARAARLRFVPRAGPGQEVAGAVAVEVRPRAPRLTLEAPLPAWERGPDGWSVHTPLRLRLDPDGGDAAWFRALATVAPTVAVTQGRARLAVVEVEPGLWEVAPKASAADGRGDLYAPRVERLTVAVGWAPGPGPGPVEVAVRVAPRWGARGWVLAGLAGLALLLGLLALRGLRPAPLCGTLLYTARALGHAVGRLDLAGRRRARIVRDARGRLALDGPGEVLASVRATRVGGVLVVPGATGGPPLRRLLVEGLQVELGEHALRYAGGAPGDAEARALLEPVSDLLGPEYDLASGRVAGLADAPPDAPREA